MNKPNRASAWYLDNWWPVRRCSACWKLYWAGWPRFRREWVCASGDITAFVVGKNCWKAWVTLWLPAWSSKCSNACRKVEV